MAESPGALEVRKARALSADFGARLTGPQLSFIQNSEFIPAALRGNLPAIGACVATGRALGLDDMTALRSIHVIDGKATFSAELMVMLARKGGHSIVGDVSPTEVTVKGTRGDNKDSMTVTWTFEQATKIKRKGKALTEGDNWKNYPEAMLWARAASQLCRMLFADCYAGATYTPEELGAGDVTADELQLEEPAAAPAAAEPEAEAEVEGEVVAEQDEPVDEEPGEVTEEQRDRLLKLVTELTEAKPDVAVGAILTEKIKKEYGAKSYNDLNGRQMDELLAYLEGELPKRKQATS
jgi:hypothetical protein